MAIETTSPNYCRSKGEQIALNVDGTTYEETNTYSVYVLISTLAHSAALYPIIYVHMGTSETVETLCCSFFHRLLPLLVCLQENDGQADLLLHPGHHQHLQICCSCVSQRSDLIFRDSIVHCVFISVTVSLALVNTQRSPTDNESHVSGCQCYFTVMGVSRGRNSDGFDDPQVNFMSLH